MKRKIYLSGAITGRNRWEREFYSAEQDIQEYSKIANVEFEIINPLFLNPKEKQDDYDYCMKQDIKALVDCNILVDIQNGSENSRGVMFEKMIASALNIKIMTKSEIIQMLIHKAYENDEERAEYLINELLENKSLKKQ